MEEIDAILDRIENYYTMKYGMDFDESEKPMSISEAKQSLHQLIQSEVKKARINEHHFIKWQPSELKFIEDQADRINSLEASKKEKKNET